MHPRADFSSGVFYVADLAVLSLIRQYQPSEKHGSLKACFVVVLSPQDVVK